MPPVPKQKQLTPLQQFTEEWKYGCGSELCKKAYHICLYRGTVPCEICLVGEAPGNTENSIGAPFMGPAGQLLDQIVSEAIQGVQFCPDCRIHIKEEGCPQCGATKGKPPRVAYTNMCCCIPKYDGNFKGGQPEEEDIQSCRPRLEAFLELCDPVLIVCVGKLPWTHIGVRRHKHSVALPDEDIQIITITHPSAILQSPSSGQYLAKQRAVTIIADAIENGL